MCFGEGDYIVSPETAKTITKHKKKPKLVTLSLCASVLVQVS